MPGATTTHATTAQLSRNDRLFDWYLMPEAYSAQLVHAAIEEFELGAGHTVLDPFCGTGTTLVASMLRGHNALGIEINPFLCFASRTKTRTDLDPSTLKLETEVLLAEARPILKRMDGEAGCPAALGDQLPDMPRLERWIARRVACKVLALRRCIEEYVSQQHRDVPMLALASILRSVSNMKLSPHAFGSREVKRDAPVMCMFERKLSKMLDDVQWLQERKAHEALGRAEVIQADVREAGGLSHPLLPAALAITSPPYLNNLDYTMQTRLELFFLGFVKDMNELKALRKRMMVSDAKAMYRDVEDWRRVERVESIRLVAEAIDERLGHRGWGWDYGRMTRQYFGGLLRAMEAVRSMLAPGAHLVMILGESAHGGVLVPVPDLAAELGRLAGYRHARVRTLRTRRSSSHAYNLKECAVVLST